jgi:hypothetical protein
MHGAGTTARPGGRPPSIGRYSRLKRQTLDEQIAEHKAHPEPLNLYDELAFLRALLEDFVNRYDTWYDALLAWHESCKRGDATAQKPTQLLDITAASRILAEIGRMVERIHTMETGGTLTVREVSNLLARMALIVETHVQDDTVKEQIREGWRTLLTG